MRYPIDNWSGYGYLYNQWTFYCCRHTGIDFICQTGTPLFASFDGIATRSYSWGGGNEIDLTTYDHNYKARYMHLSQIVRTGAVKTGDLIGYSGNSGALTTGSHLHFDLTKAGNFVNPFDYLTKNIYMETFKEALQRLYWDYLNRGCSDKELKDRLDKYPQTFDSVNIIRKEFNSSKERKARLFDIYKAYKKRYPKKFKKLPKFDDWYKFQVDHATPFYRIYQAMFI